MADEIINEDVSIRKIMRGGRRAKVSDIVICLKLIGLLPPGFIFAIVDPSDAVVYSGRSAGTFIEAPPKNFSLCGNPYSDTHAVHEAMRSGRGVVHWWQFGVGVVMPESSDPRTSTQVLRDIIASQGYDGQKGNQIFWSINGRAGYANGMRKALTASSLFAAFLEKFAVPKDPSGVVSHPDFKLYLAKKADEITVKKAISIKGKK